METVSKESTFKAVSCAGEQRNGSVTDQLPEGH